MALTEIKTSGIADDAVTTDKLANAINTARDANTAKASITINNNADNRVITGSDTANTLEGEANLTFDGTSLLTVHVPSATGEPAINFTNSDTGTGTGNGFGLGINSSESPYIWNRENTDLRIATNNTERMRIDSSGNVGIGTDSPSKKLHVYESGVSYLRLETGAANGQAWDFLSTYGGSANTGTLSIRNESGSSFLDLQENGGSPRTTISNGGSVQFQFDADGVKFNGDTASANGLDDYEEGSWTPALYNSGGITVHSASYTKIGKLCNVSAYVTISSNSSSSIIRFNTLPFTAANVGYSIGSAYTQNTGATHVFSQIDGNSTNIIIYKTNGGTVYQSELSGAYVLFSGTYRTT